MHCEPWNISRVTRAVLKQVKNYQSIDACHKINIKKNVLQNVIDS